MAKTCTIRDLIVDLSRYDPDEQVLSEVWFTDDVINIDETATSAETQATLEWVAQHFDASLGINWEALECALACVRERGSHHCRTSQVTRRPAE